MLQRRDISNRWRMFEACKPGDYRCSECAEQVIDPDGKVATCACECHVWLDDDLDEEFNGFKYTCDTIGQD